MHHLRNGLNEAGNRLEDFTLNQFGKLLYNATSAYGLFCCMLHKIVFHPEEPADLMLSVWRKDKISAVRDTKIFEEIILWDDLKYRSIDYAMDRILENATEVEFLEQEWRFFKEYEKLLPFKINEYKEIIIAGNSMPFGCYLERNQVPYDVIEDGAGIFSNPALLLHYIQDTYPALERYMICKYKIFEGSKYCQKTYINYAVQTGKYSESNTVDFRPVKLVEKLPVWQRRDIMRVFGVKEANVINNRKTCLLLTYPLAQGEKLTVSEEKMVYTLLADIFAGDCEEYHLKAHPDDRTDFSEIERFQIINRHVLSELLWYETKTEYDVAISAVSTSLNNLLCVKKGITLDIVVLHQNGQDTAHYVDSFGYKEVPEFLQEQTQQLTPDARMTGEQIRTPRGSFSVTDMTAEQKALSKAKQKDSHAYLALTMIQAICREEKQLSEFLTGKAEPPPVERQALGGGLFHIGS